MRSRSTTDLTVVYTNEPWSVDRIIAMFERFLREGKYKVVGFDLEDTRMRAGYDQKVIIVQL